MSALPRVTCPACTRRYAGTVAPDCPVCNGLGVLTLGAPALHHHPAAAVARAVELYLEAKAQLATARLPLTDRRPALEAAVDELRVAGVLHRPEDASRAPAHLPALDAPTTIPVTELAAHRYARTLTGQPVTNATLAALRTTAPTLAHGRPRDGRLPTASANGHRSQLATIADPIDALGPDTYLLEHARRATTHEGTVIAAAVPDTIRRRTRKPTP